MIDLHSPVKIGFLVNQNGRFPIQEIIVRGSTQVAVNAASQPGGEELPGGMDIDLPSFIDFCKHALLETGTLPRWFYIGVILDADHSQLRTYFSPNKQQFFSDIYNSIKEELAVDLPMADTETVVKEFFEYSMGYRFHYQVIPLETLLSGSKGGKAYQTDVRL
jgi:hypothetical protein